MVLYFIFSLQFDWKKEKTSPPSTVIRSDVHSRSWGVYVTSGVQSWCVQPHCTLTALSFTVSDVNQSSMISGHRKQNKAKQERQRQRERKRERERERDRDRDRDRERDRQREERGETERERERERRKGGRPKHITEIDFWETEEGKKGGGWLKQKPNLSVYTGVCYKKKR